MEDTKPKIYKVLMIVLRIVIVVAILLMMLFVIKVAPNYSKGEYDDKTNLIINNNNITRDLKSDVIIKDGVIYLSVADVTNFFDEYLLIEEERVITTTSTKTVVIPFDGTVIEVNGSNVEIEHEVLQENDTVYLPMSDLTTIYNYEIAYSESNDIVTVDSLNRKMVQVTASKKLSIKYKATVFSKTVDKVASGDTLIVVLDKTTGEAVTVDDWVQVRTANGEIGYVKQDKVENETVVRGAEETESSIDGKISLVWDYYSQYVTAPIRTGEIEGVNVLSPSFYEITASGDLDANIGVNGQNYISWAHENGYEVWPMVSNSELGDLDAMSSLLSTYETREYLINSIVTALVSAGVDGVNIDFENMYQSDKDNYSRFIIELAPRLEAAGLTLSVDVTAPDGSETWSLCFDRTVIGDVADYIIFMAYDQNGSASTEAGTVAGADWVELNIKKFIGQEGVDSSKIILGIPFYTRLWKETEGTLTSSVVNMRSVTIPDGVEKVWDEDTKQYYIEYEQNGATYKMWIEDEESIKAKLELINEYNLAGAGFWSKDRESNTIWSIIAEELGI